MIEYYAAALAVHVCAVTLSGALFAVRGAAVLAGGGWAMSAPLRYASYAIDTLLLVAALLLVVMLPAGLFANHWLAAKLVLLVLYMALGSLALKRARTAPLRAFSYAAALAVFLQIAGTAYFHSPLGWLALLT